MNKIHSCVDLITNSSTEIFMSTSEDGVTKIKTFIDKILKTAESDKTADDLFTFEVTVPEESYSDCGYTNNSIIIKEKNKDGISVNLVELIKNIFSIDGERNG